MRRRLETDIPGFSFKSFFNDSSSSLERSSSPDSESDLKTSGRWVAGIRISPSSFSYASGCEAKMLSSIDSMLVMLSRFRPYVASYTASVREIPEIIHSPWW